MGEIAFVEFILNSNATTDTPYASIVCNGTVTESYLFGAYDSPATSGSWTLVDDNILEGRIVYWNDESRPLRYEAATPANYVVTDITGVNASCNTPSTPVNPDQNGYFNYDINNGDFVSLNRDILGGSTGCLLYTSPSPRDLSTSRMPSSA